MRSTARLTIGALVVLVLPLTSACFSYTPVSELAPPAGPSAEELAAEMNIPNLLGIDDTEYWPAAGDPAALVSCAVAFRPEDIDEVPSVSYLMNVDRVSETDLERIVDTFCGTFTREVYERVPLDWLPESEVMDAIAHRTEDPDEQLAMAYGDYGYFGGIGGVAPLMNSGMRSLAREMDRAVFLGGITVRLSESGELRFGGNDLTLQGWIPRDRMLQTGGDVAINGPGRYLVDDYAGVGLETLAEALAIRFAHMIETGSMDWGA